MAKKTILLLNPPWEQVYFRDLYCSASAKGHYLWHPVDLVVLSGILKERFNVEFIDCIASGAGLARALELAGRKDIHGVIFLISSRTQKSDLELAGMIKNKTKAKVIANGGVALYEYERILKENPFLDGILFDFTSADALRFFSGAYGEIKNMAFRDDSNQVRVVRERENKGIYRHPVPLHELFISSKYFVPGSTCRHYSSVLTSYGCAFNCSFCTYNNRALGFKHRLAEDIFEELRYVKSLKVREVHFRDACFPGLNKEYIRLYRKMRESRINLRWLCNTRVDMVNKDILAEMKSAGCRTIFFGVESGDDDILKQQSKRITTEQIRLAFKWCGELGIRTGAFFIFGFPQDTILSMSKTIELAKNLDCYIASFNLAMPLEGTQLRENLLSAGASKIDLQDGFDISSGDRVVANKTLDPAVIIEYKRKAVKEFYSRPGYLLKYILQVRSLRELRGMFLNAVSLFKDNIRNRGVV